MLCPEIHNLIFNAEFSVIDRRILINGHRLHMSEARTSFTPFNKFAKLFG